MKIGWKFNGWKLRRFWHIFDTNNDKNSNFSLLTLLLGVMFVTMIINTNGILSNHNAFECAYYVFYKQSKRLLP